VDVVDAAALADVLASPAALAALAPGPAGGALVVDLRTAPAGLDLAPLAQLPAVVVAIADAAARTAAGERTGLPDAAARAGPGADARANDPGEGHTARAADVVVADEDAAEAVVAAVYANPLAATTLAVHLRASATLDVEAGLVAESATYSLLQAGPEHLRWLAARPPHPPRPGDGERVRAERSGHRLTVTLARPSVRNAVDAAMQQALADALLAAAEPDITEVVLAGDGPSFSTGGDLAEFGSLADPVSAHLVRLGRSPARALARVAGRTTAVVHGPCYGAGVELPAFARRVIARPGTTFTLPEVAMGLVPGAGGTVSLPRRIGRQHTAWLAITGHALDATTARDWGLVDEIAGADGTRDTTAPGSPGGR